MIIEFSVGEKWSEGKVSICYNKDEYSFDIVPAVDGYSPLLINDLNLVLSENNLLLGVWGLCPHLAWELTDYKPPKSEKRNMFVNNNKLIEAGATLRINESKWNVYFNKKISYVCIGSPKSIGKAIEFTNGAILVMSSKNEVLSLWIHINETVR